MISTPTKASAVGAAVTTTGAAANRVVVSPEVTTTVPHNSMVSQQQPHASSSIEPLPLLQEKEQQGTLSLLTKKTAGALPILRVNARAASSIVPAVQQTSHSSSSTSNSNTSNSPYRSEKHLVAATKPSPPSPPPTKLNAGPFTKSIVQSSSVVKRPSHKQKKPIIRSFTSKHRLPPVEISFCRPRDCHKKKKKRCSSSINHARKTTIQRKNDQMLLPWIAGQDSKGSLAADSDDESDSSAHGLAVSDSPSELTTPTSSILGVCSGHLDSQDMEHGEDEEEEDHNDNEGDDNNNDDDDDNPTGKRTRRHDQYYAECCPFDWIKPNVKYMVHCGPDRQNSMWDAKTLGPPYPSTQDGRWVVDVVWDWGKELELEVDCNRFLNVQRGDRTKAHCRSKNKASTPRDAEQEQPPPKRVQRNSQIVKKNPRRTTHNNNTKKKSRHQSLENGKKDTCSSPPALRRQRVAQYENDNQAGCCEEATKVGPNDSSANATRRAQAENNNNNQVVGCEESSSANLLKDKEPEDGKRFAAVTNAESSEVSGCIASEPDDGCKAKTKANASDGRLPDATHGLHVRDTETIKIIQKGMKIKKLFEDGKVYSGMVDRRAPECRTTADGRRVLTWHVTYEDGDQEDMEKDEILRFLAADRPQARSACRVVHTKQQQKRTNNDKRLDEKTKPDAFSLPPAIRQQRVLQAENKKQKIDGCGEATELDQNDSSTNPNDKEREDGKRVAIANTESEEADSLSLDPEEGSKAKAHTDVGRNKRTIASKGFQDSLHSMLQMGSIPREEAENALISVGRPYSIQEATHVLHVRDTETIKIEKGMKIKKLFEDGKVYRGTVDRDPEFVPNANGRLVQTWHVTYEDGDEEEMEKYEIIRYAAEIPKTPSPCRGRPLQCLELFSGCGRVSEEFIKRGWLAESVDNAANSYPTIRKDILELNPEVDLPFVPDFIWASPPCQTYSRITRGKHRSKEPGSFNKTKETHHHDRLFTKMAEIIAWAMSKHPHLIVVIENPVGLLQHMPLMKELETRVVKGLEKVQVHYCAFGRDEKKPTFLWTNNKFLRDSLSEFVCQKRCQVGQNHLSTQNLISSGYNVSAIPQALAEEVAHVVDAVLLVMHSVRFLKASDP